MLKSFGQIASLLKDAKNIQGRMEEMKSNLANVQVEGSAGGGMVTVTANGKQRIVSLKIEESLLENPDQEMLEDLLLAAINQALTKAQEAAASEMAKVAGDVNIPGLGDAISKFTGEDSEEVETEE